MIPKECKRLAEVDFPIAVVSKHSAREKSIRHGHPSTLHLWWARRPLAACRSMLLALLLPDPCDEHCPEDFKTQARRLFAEHPFVGIQPGPTDLDLRKALLQFIGDFANWDVSSQQDYLAVGRGLVKAAHPEEPPLVVDPFAGGGSIPLEALRLGCEAFASDLNPVACLILKVMLEDIPRYGPELADELRRVGAEIKAAAEKELAEFYPPDPDGARPIAYLWARTVRCEAPNCGAEIPLMRSFWLCKKPNRKKALRPKVVRHKGKPPEVEFEIFEPKSDSEVHAGTVSRAKATCLCCNTVLPAERVRAQLRAQRGGADPSFDEAGHRVAGARLLAVATTQPGRQGRDYRLPKSSDYEAVWQATKAVASLEHAEVRPGVPAMPDEPTPSQRGHRAVGSPRLYGMTTWGDLFTVRQKLLFGCLSKHICSMSGSAPELAEATALALSRFSDISNALCRWENSRAQVRNLFTRHDLPMLWDFAEADPLGHQAGDFAVTVHTMARVAGSLGVDDAGEVQQADAVASPLPDASAHVWFTDPPYYDAVAYADLSDFFLVWLKRALPTHRFIQSTLRNAGGLSPKAGELTVTTLPDESSSSKDSRFFDDGMGEAFAEGHRILQGTGAGCVVFAHKTTEGWEALLSGMVRGGLNITASWPIATELRNRLNARENAALATSVHLVCRPRPEDAPVGDWDDVLRELPRRVGDWMERLQSEGVRGADLVFACIGPALEVYSRYSRVETAEGHEVPLGGDPEAREPERRGFLAYVWEVIGRTALEQVLGTAEAQARNGAAGALEEDARLTALFLWTLQSTNGNGEETTKDKGDTKEDEGTADDELDDEDEEESGSRRRARGGFTLVYDVVRRFAQPLGIHLDEWEGRIIKTEKGVVRLLPVTERAKQLFGEDGAQAVAQRIETDAAVAANPQMTLFSDEAPTVRGRRRTRAHAGAKVADQDLQTRREATTLDRLHAAMLLQASGRTNALRALLRAEVDRGPDFVRLANALSALYPMGCEEKRLLDAMLLAVPR